EQRRRRHEEKAGRARSGFSNVETAWRELQEVLDGELRALPEKFRAPLVLCCLEGLTQDEAAQRLGWPVGTVKSRLAPARDELRERLVQRGLTLCTGTFAIALAANAAAATLPVAVSATLDSRLDRFRCRPIDSERCSTSRVLSCQWDAPHERCAQSETGY